MRLLTPCLIALMITGPALAAGSHDDQAAARRGLLIGWAEADITPERPVSLAGQFHVRIAERARDPLTATVLLLEADGDGPSPTHAVWVSCDLISIRNELRDGVREHVRALIPELDPQSVILTATHTHTAPHTGSRGRSQEDADADIMSPAEYTAFVTRRVAEAIRTAWDNRAPGGVAFGLGHAVVGHNRLVSYDGGSSRMYGRVNDPTFSHIEGYEDHSVHVLLTYDTSRQLTGMVLNVASPSQVTENLREVSADFWHETRQELRRRFGDHLRILPQCGAAGDQAPRPLLNARAENRMLRLAGHDRRQEIAVRIADAVARVMPLAEQETDWSPVLKRHSEIVELPRRRITPQELDQARAAAVTSRQEYERLSQQPDADPQAASRARSLLRRHERVIARYEQQDGPGLPYELHVVRLGDVAFATNPFELYLDYGVRIQSFSPAVQTFVVQLAGSGSYLPPERSIAGGAYGAVPASNAVGPEGGKVLVDWTVGTITALFED